MNENQFADIETIEDFGHRDLSEVLRSISSHQKLADIVATAFEKNPRAFTLSEQELESSINPQVLYRRIRIAFWHEVEQFLKGKILRVRLAQVYGGLTTASYFYHWLESDYNHVAYLLCPPKDYQLALKETLALGIDKLREIIAAPVLDEDGNLLPRAADVVLKAIQHVDTRVKGAVVQKIDQRTLTLHMKNDQRSVEAPQYQNMDELDRALQIAKQKVMAIEASANVLDVSPQPKFLEEK